MPLRCGGIENHTPTGRRVETQEVSCQGPHWHPRQWHLQLPNRWKPSIRSDSLSSVQHVSGALPVLLPGCFFQFSVWQQLMNSSSIASRQEALQEFGIHPRMRTMAQFLRSISLSFPGLPPTIHLLILPRAASHSQFFRKKGSKETLIVPHKARTAPPLPRPCSGSS